MQRRPRQDDLPETAARRGLRGGGARRRVWIRAVYVLLFALSVPWYLPAGGPLRLWFGLPHWVVLSLGACLAVAVFTVYVAARHWPAPPADRDAADPDAADREGAP